MSMLFKRIINWATSITAFRTGDVIPVDGPSGTAKMSKDDLLQETAQNALAGNVAPAFDPTKPNDDGGYAYYADEIVAYNGSTYKFKVNHSSGAWNAAEVTRYDAGDVLEYIVVKDNPKYLVAFTDKNGAFLFGALKDGSFDWQVGVPQNVKDVIENNFNQLIEAINTKVDKVDGKGLIQSEVSDAIKIISNDVYLFAITDVNDVLLLGFRYDGTAYVLGIDKLIEANVGDIDTLASKEYVTEKVSEEEARAVAAETDLQEQINSIEPTIVEGGENNPDEEFITSVNDKLTFKNISKTINSRGTIYLHTIDSFSSVVTETNTTYVIKDSFNLGGSNIELPAGCCLKFVGGSVYNGTLTGDFTRLEYIGTPFGQNINIAGTWDVDYIRSDMIVDPYSNLKKLTALLNAYKYQVFEVLKSNTEYVYTPQFNYDGFLGIKSNTRLVINGTLRIGTNGEYGYYIVSCGATAKNIIIEGSGKLCGDVSTHEFEPGSTDEGGHGVYLISGCKNIIVRGLTIEDTTGDGVLCVGSMVEIRDCTFNHISRNGVSIGDFSTQVRIEDCRFSDIFRTAPKLAIDLEPNDTNKPCSNIVINNIYMESCTGISCSDCDSVKISNIKAKNVVALLGGRNAGKVRIEDVICEISESIIPQPFVVFTGTCKDVSIDRCTISSSLTSIIVDFSNVLLGYRVIPKGLVSFSGTPKEASVRYNGGAFQYYNGNNWQNI